MTKKKRTRDLADLNRRLQREGLSRARAQAETAKLAALSDVLEALGKIAGSLNAIDLGLGTLDSSVRMIDTRLVFLEETIRLRGEKAIAGLVAHDKRGLGRSLGAVPGPSNRVLTSIDRRSNSRATLFGSIIRPPEERSCKSSGFSRCSGR